jgi:hypothetical protein
VAVQDKGKPHWGRLVAGPRSIGFKNTVGMAIVVAILLACLVLTLLTVPICSLIVLVVLFLLGFELGFPLVEDLMGTGPDARVYENGIEHITTFGRGRFYAWDRFEGWEFFDSAVYNNVQQRVMVVYMKDRVRSSDPDRITIGPSMDYPQVAWYHIMERMPRYNRT